MNWFSRFLTGNHAVRKVSKVRPAYRFWLEVLEDRTLLNNRFVVPLGASVNNVANFATLSAALSTPGLASGNTIQIEPGAAPGDTVNADYSTAFATATYLTIKGDPAVAASAVPRFTISDATNIGAAHTLNLRNANLGVITAGALTFNGNANISQSILVDVNSNALVPFRFAGTSDNLTNSTVANNVAVAGVLQIITNAAGTNNLISGNTFVSNASGTNVQVSWFGGANVVVTDKLVNNTFIVSPGTTENENIQVVESISGLVIQNNTLSGNAEYGIDQFGFNPTNLKILNNTIELTGAFFAIRLISSAAESATIKNNVIETNATGGGLLIDVGAAGLKVGVQGNDFHNNKIGVTVVAGANSIADVDLGGGTQGSLGDNNFHGYNTVATALSGAIVTDSTMGAMLAKYNIFSVGDPQTVIFKGGFGTVITTPVAVPKVTRITRLRFNAVTGILTYQVVFSMPVARLDVSHFRLTTIGVPQAQIRSITGSGTTYTVTVFVGTRRGLLGIGFIGLDVVYDKTGVFNGPITAV